MINFRKQQVEIEHEVRRRYGKKWGDCIKDPRINSYSNEKLNKTLQKFNGGGRYFIFIEKPS